MWLGGHIVAAFFFHKAQGGSFSKYPPKGVGFLLVSQTPANRGTTIPTCHFGVSFIEKSLWVSFIERFNAFRGYMQAKRFPFSFQSGATRIQKRAGGKKAPFEFRKHMLKNAFMETHEPREPPLWLPSWKHMEANIGSPNQTPTGCTKFGTFRFS